MRKKTDSEFSGGFGKMVKGKHSVLLEKDELSDTQNMQPGYGWRQRRGMSALTASAVASGLRWKSLCQFRELTGTTDVLLAHTYDSSGGEDLYQGSALPPSSITWTKKYDLTANCEKCQFANVANAILIANNKDFLIWRGTSHKPTGVWYYDNTNSAYINYFDEMTDGNTSTVMPLDSLDAANDFWYVLSEQPLDTVSPVAGSANANGSVLIGYYWNGAWTEINSGNGCGAFNDGTASKVTGATSVVWDEFDGTTIDSNQWTELDANNKLSQNDGLTFTPDADGIVAYYLGDDAGAANNITGDFDIVMKVTAGTSTTNTASGSNSVRLYLLKSGQTNTNIYVGRYAGTGVIRHYSEIYTGGVRDDEGWTDIAHNAELTWYYRITRVGNAVATYEGEPGAWTELAADATWGNNSVGVRLYFDCDDESEWDGNCTVHWVRSGVSAAQSGDITWDPPSDEVVTEIGGVPGYAYRFGYTADLDADTTFTGLTVHSPMASVKNIWDGQYINPTGCYTYDGSAFTDAMAYVNNTVESQYADLSAATTSYALFVGFPFRVNEIELYPAAQGKNSANAQVDYVGYYNASGAVTSLTFTDTTLDDAADSSFAQKGSLYWVDPGRYNEKMTTIAGDRVPMYWYKIEWDATLTDPTYIYYIRGVPIHDDPDYSYGVFAYKRRAWQIAPMNEENALRYSAENMPNVWNGPDSGYIYFGERPLRAAAPFYNEAIIYADTEMWMLQGNKPVNFGRLRLSSMIGIASPQSLIPVESGVVVNDTIKIVLVWFYFDGIWMFDGVRLWKISAPDIDSFFDPDHDDYINPAKLSETTGVYDYESQCVMWNVYSGSAATTPTKTIVLHFPTLRFGIYDYATDLDAMLSVINNRYYTVAGGNSDGRFYQLNSGLTDLNGGTATAVDAFIITRDEFMGYSDGTRQRLMSVWVEAQEAGGQLELDEYPDGSKTPQNIAKLSLQKIGKIFTVLQRTLKLFVGQKATKFRIRNRSKNARMNVLGKSVTIDRDRANE